MQNIMLNNDVKMPAEGLGTFLMSPADAEMATLNALRAGFRHIDTANGYYNEAVNPFVATETYHRQADGSWKLISFVYTHILPENYQFRFLSE